MKKLPSILGVLVALSGCNATVETEVKLSELLDAKGKMLAGSLYVEVAGCNSYEDSRQPSEMVLDAQKMIPQVFGDAKYVECFTKQFDSYAHFSVPIALDKTADGKIASDDHINLVSNEQELLSVLIPEQIKKNIKSVEQSTFAGSGFDIEVNLKLKNDTGKDFTYQVISAYVEGQPHINNPLTAPKGSVWTIKLSDVSVSTALERQSAQVLVR